jgi:multidrug efflux pump subunit AcrB
MWIVRLALRRPYTFVVLALLLLIVGPLTILRTPTDIFPNIDIPVLSVIGRTTACPPTKWKSASCSITSAAWRPRSTILNIRNRLR